MFYSARRQPSWMNSIREDNFYYFTKLLAIIILLSRFLSLASSLCFWLQTLDFLIGFHPMVFALSPIICLLLKIWFLFKALTSLFYSKLSSLFASLELASQLPAQNQNACFENINMRPCKLLLFASAKRSCKHQMTKKTLE